MAEDSKFSEEVIIHTDSEYVQKGITEWMETRIRRQWRLSKGGKLVKNADLWQELHRLVTYFPKLQWKRVRAHVGHEMNERVDDLARGEAESRAL